MTFDPYMPIGRRLKQISDIQEEHPIVLDHNKPVPLSAVSPPHCNAGQSLIWYPKNPSERAKILVPPRQIIVPWESWLADMMPNRQPNVQKPRDCKYVGEYGIDEEIGTMHTDTHGTVGKTLSSKFKSGSSSYTRQFKSPTRPKG